MKFEIPVFRPPGRDDQPTHHNGVAAAVTVVPPSTPFLPTLPEVVVDPPRHSAPAGISAFDRVDWAVVKQLHLEVSREVGAGSPDGDRAAQQHQAREAAKRRVRAYVDERRRQGEVLSADDERLLLETLIAELVGLGRLQLLLKDSLIENVHILGASRVRVEYADGRIEAGPPVADDDDELLHTLQNLATRAAGTERSMTTAEPWLDLELPDGSRLAALYEVTPPSVGTATRTIPFAQIRRHRHRQVTLEDLAGPEMNMISPLMADFLRAAMAARLNIMIAGVGGAGKTTLLRALAAEIPEKEAYAVLEDSRELGLHTTGRHPFVMSLESRQGHGEQRSDGRPRGEVSTADLIPRMLRMSVQRIIVGEVRSREVVAMLQAMTVSQGSLCTIHARRADLIFDRIVELALWNGRDMTVDLAMRTAANALDLLVFVEMEDEAPIGGSKHRYVSHIVEVDGSFEGGVPVRTNVFAPGADGRGVPTAQPSRTGAQLARVGLDVRRFNPDLNPGQPGWPRPIRRVERGWR